MSASLDHEWIAAHIPHQGRMCLLDEVVAWNATSLRCRASSHRRTDNPLADSGRLSAVCAIEYAAQAMAVHGALGVSPQAPSARPAAGFLAALRSVNIHALWLNEIESDLICEVTQLAGDDHSALYEFKVSSAECCLLDGRATVLFDAGAKGAA